ncbi:MAG: D-xylose transport system permease protein [Frankiales bacterium]|jgi:D-xylose transport system permease protein|nr:D-xylose transport system permease protein [Frankiales bacterium]
MTTTAVSETTGAPAPAQIGLVDTLKAYRDKVRGGDIGSLPAILGLVALVLFFSLKRPNNFPTAFNFANLITQGAAVMVLSMGLIFVLLLGEIDLSAGFTAGTSAAVMAKFMANHGWPWPLGMLACIVTGLVIGTTIGTIVTRLGIPSFVVTLAGFLALGGVQLAIVGEGGSIQLPGKAVYNLDNANLPIWLGWVLFLVVAGGFAGLNYYRIIARRRIGLATSSLSVWALKSVTIAVILGLATAFLSKQRSPASVASIKGVPDVVLLLLFLLLSLTFLLVRTPLGRHIYAIGGNAEAARRAGINVPLTKTFCFIMCSTMAGVAGIVYASNANSVSAQTGGGTDLLLAVGAAVIGGCSLFGGRGRILDAVIGGLVVVVISNGMLLLNLKDAYVQIFSGLVLLVAASVDAISRRRAQASGG